LKHYELESYLKSFLLFFILMLSLYLLLEWQNYKEQHTQIDQTILNEMQIFSYKPLSGNFDVSFVPHKDTIPPILTLHKEEKNPFALFEIPGSKKYLLKVSLAAEKYQHRLKVLKEKIYEDIYGYIFLILIVAALLAYYALYPLKKALQINQEFVKDILHDINTPLSALLVNLNILQKRFGKDRGFDRMANSIETIQNLQSNLKSFLHRQPSTISPFPLQTLLERRLEYFRVLYPHVHFLLEMESNPVIYTNMEAFTRILDNILSNAGKYNTRQGEVRVRYLDEKLIIEDTGIGIKHPEKVFTRYYKEGERGLGLGLHIVKKLAKELEIDISLKSKREKGTTVTLTLSKVTEKSQS